MPVSLFQHLSAGAHHARAHVIRDAALTAKGKQPVSPSHVPRVTKIDSGVAGPHAHRLMALGGELPAPLGEHHAGILARPRVLKGPGEHHVGQVIDAIGSKVCDLLLHFCGRKVLGRYILAQQRNRLSELRRDERRPTTRAGDTQHMVAVRQKMLGQKAARELCDTGEERVDGRANLRRLLGGRRFTALLTFGAGRISATSNSVTAVDCECQKKAVTPVCVVGSRRRVGQSGRGRRA